MNNLKCDVTSCQHNCDHLCCLNKINVEGPGACTTDQTCCSSFDCCNSSCASNNISSHSASPSTDICCKAVNCTHNKNKKCQATNVQMECMCNCPEVMSQTACHTFCPR